MIDIAIPNSLIDLGSSHHHCKPTPINRWLLYVKEQPKLENTCRAHLIIYTASRTLNYADFAKRYFHYFCF